MNVFITIAFVRKGKKTYRVFARRVYNSNTKLCSWYEYSSRKLPVLKLIQPTIICLHMFFLHSEKFWNFRKDYGKVSIFEKNIHPWDCMQRLIIFHRSHIHNLFCLHEQLQYAFWDCQLMWMIFRNDHKYNLFYLHEHIQYAFWDFQM